MVTSSIRLRGRLRGAPDDYQPMRLPPYPFPPPPDEPAFGDDGSTSVDSALLAAAIASLWALHALTSPERLSVTWAAMTFGPIGVVGVLGALLGRGAANGNSVAGPAIAMGFASLYGVFFLQMSILWWLLRNTPDGTVAVFAMVVIGFFVALFFLVVSLPAAVAWALLLRELFGAEGSLRHLARRARRICLVLIASALLLGTYRMAAGPWVPLL